MVLKLNKSTCFLLIKLKCNILSMQSWMWYYTEYVTYLILSFYWKVYKQSELQKIKLKIM